ncbi:putative O-linked N-acetylglucosamine transferase, SPINDLY family; TPR domain protein [Bradyrhizobium sp. ORS 278]|uniref:O-linked N-acetylglucosamine transferase, SPINDLY family protein n=1 Tax=Bradyrhizobium sp. (strain ORS 278) TaxID=114615 RepID=UPI00015086C5|nr:tetratricopeptide repeat protein [Bradyrhizobium sp. ORS 278]CAL78844.1 putative O-linked N-acetylglucosamine transferase, SPINDLY family; TPR domain protein [Bradyrhizobium sp. ORS 278]
MAGNVGSRAFQNARLLKQHRKQVDDLLPRAVAAYRAGTLAEAQAICSRILALLPHHFDTLHLLGVVALDGGQLDLAEQALTRAVEIEPRHAEALSNLGLALFNRKRYEEARKCQERAVALKPNLLVALTGLGNTLMRLGLPEEAIAAHDRAIALKPDFADAYCNRGMALLPLGRNVEADQSFDRALSLNPRHMEAMFGKGLASIALRHSNAALAAFDAALAIRPRAAQVLAQRGRLHQQAGRFDPAMADFQAALAIDPRQDVALMGFAQLSVIRDNIAPAMEACRKVLEQNPQSEVAWTWLGECFCKQGDLAAGLAHFERALEIKPDFGDAITAKIFLLDFMPDTDFAQHQAVRREWWTRIGAEIARRPTPVRARDPERRLTIGYVSSDFRTHSAALVFLPVLRHHDHHSFKVVCYSCSPLQDTMTAQCRAVADVWVDAWQMSDDELTERIEADAVDILVDLSGHSAGNRLPVFARKPAPIQVTAWGSGTGTGLPTMDYFFADPVTVPEDVRHLFAEQVYDLPAVITTDPLQGWQPTPLPMLRNGHVTFGVFNRIDKISDPALALWARLMAALPNSRIVIKNGALDDSLVRNALVARFVAHGIAEGRITCLGLSSREQHIAQFAAIDMSLDPFPQNGGVSTWESLQAGVPVICKLGRSAAGRAAAAINTAVGLPGWVAADDEDYVAMALKHATQPEELAKLRAALPAMAATSEAGNVETYTRKVEEGYRRFWCRYCTSS